jgi:hypothetical protein
LEKPQAKNEISTFLSINWKLQGGLNYARVLAAYADEPDKAPKQAQKDLEE